MDSGLRKLKRKDYVRSAVLTIPPELHGAIFVYGRIRSGKTAALLYLAQIYRDNPQRNYKIFDLWGGYRVKINQDTDED